MELSLSCIKLSISSFVEIQVKVGLDSSLGLIELFEVLSQKQWKIIILYSWF